MRKIGLNPEDFVGTLSIKEFLESIDKNFLAESSISIREELEKLGFCEKELQLVNECLTENKCFKVVAAPQLYFANLRRIVEQFVKHRSKVSRLIPKEDKFSNKVSTLVRQGVIPETIERDLIYIWKKTSKYLHGPLDLPSELILRDFIICQKMLLDILKRFVY